MASKLMLANAPARPPNESKSSVGVYWTRRGTIVFVALLHFQDPDALKPVGPSCHEIRAKWGALPIEGKKGEGGPPPTATRGPRGDELVAPVRWASLSQHVLRSSR